MKGIRSILVRVMILNAAILLHQGLNAQKIDSIAFHLYTDSLKKGQFNYINVDGKMPDGKWLPLTAKEIDITCDQAEFRGTELVIPVHTTLKIVTVKAVLKADRNISAERTIWIKQAVDPPLPKKAGY